MFTVWYVGGQEKLWPLWRHYFNNTDGFFAFMDTPSRTIYAAPSVTGLNNNEYQISRGKELNRLAGVSGTCNFVKGLPSAAGHEAGQRLLEETVRLSRAWGIHALTAFAFSKENWSRPKVEVDFLMRLFERVIHDSVAEFLREGIRLRVIGDCSRLPVSLQKTAREAEEATRSNSQLDLILAISYSGRRDIVQACRNLAQKVHGKLLRPEDINESLFADELETSCADEFPYPDLLIRTSGELRLSNFLLWQSAYSELFFTNTLWPDFGEADYLEALSSFQGRERRFGLRKL